MKTGSNTKKKIRMKMNEDSKLKEKIRKRRHRKWKRNATKRKPESPYIL